MREQLVAIFSAVLWTVVSLGGHAPANSWAQELATNVLTEIDGLVRLKDIDPSIRTEMRYASENNFTRKIIYSSEICVLKKETALKLSRAQQEFRKNGYSLKVWDAYRPPSVQKIFWDLVPDERYVADPSKGGSRHNRGGAVDVTLVDEDGQELEMPTGFDDFSEKASPSSRGMSAQAQKNVELLRRIMIENGFSPMDTEWWHFDDTDWEQYPLVDVDVKRFELNTGEMLLTWMVPSILNNIDKKTRQAIVLQNSSSKPRLTTWEYKDERWQAVFKPMDVAIGKNGLARPEEKREGDGRTPSGIYRLGMAFGYDLAVRTELAYHRVTDNDFWVDDPASPWYNQWVVGIPMANSYEKLKRDDDQYKLAIVIDYNVNPIIPGRGSAIFLHVWRGAGQSTAGCVAVAQEDLLKILAWLNRYKNPVIVLGQEFLGKSAQSRSLEESVEPGPQNELELEPIEIKG